MLLVPKEFTKRQKIFHSQQKTPFFKAQAICFLSSFGYCHVRNSGHRIHRHFMTSCSSQGKKDSSGKSGMSCIQNDVIDHESKVKKPKRNKYSEIGLSKSLKSQ